MKKALLFSAFLSFFSHGIYAQKQDVDMDVERIFTLTTRIFDGDYNEQKIFEAKKTAHLAVVGSQFKIVGKNDDGFIIEFNRWDSRSKNALTRSKAYEFNYKDTSIVDSEGDVVEDIKTEDDNLKLFYITKEDLLISTAEFGNDRFFDVKLGALVVPFKFRFGPTNFSSDFSLGSVLMFQHQDKRILDLNYGFGVGLSLSKVNLDSFSTAGFVSATTERPAFTPSVNLLVGYKLINVTLAAGIDYINEISPVEKSWRYNGKPWIGFGFGISLFTPGSDKALPKSDQSKK